MENINMNPDEAIEILKTHLLLPRVTGTREEDIEPHIKAEKALNMAILALTWYNQCCELHEENKQLKEQIENQTCHIKEERVKLIDLQRENDCLKNIINKINQIVSKINQRESVLVNNYPKIVTKSKGFDQISEVFKDE